jgi:glycosyltransferase involved in cell wall biosynthesis
MPMRILHLIDSLDYGGAEKLLMAYIPLLDSDQHIVVTLNGPNVYDQNSYIYRDLNINPRKNIFKAVLLIRNIIKENDVDIVHSHSFWTNIISRLATPKRVRLFNHYHFADYDTMKQKSSVKRMILLDKIFIHKSLVRLAVSEYVATILKKEFPKAIIKVIPNFINCIPAEQGKKEKNNRNLRIVAVGNCNLEKNYQMIIESFALLKEEPFSLDIIGGGEKLDFYKDQLRSLEINNVRFLGYVPDVRTRIKQYDLFLSASISETFGIAILEAICARLPLLLSNIPAFKEIAPKSALFFNPQDKTDLIEKLRFYFKNRTEPEYDDYDRTLCKYSADTFIAELHNIYNN